MSISTAQLLAPYQARPWARITPGVTPGIPVTPTHHTSQADAYRDYYRPPQPYSPPPMSSSTSCSGFSRSTGAVHDPYTHLPTPVDDTHHTQPLHPHDEDGLRQTSHTRNASLSDGELDETSNYEYMPDGDVDQTSDYGYMSDGELDQTSDNEYMSEGEVRPDTRMLGSLPARPPSARPSADQPADSNSELDVVAVAKERVAGMLKLRDPKLLQSPKFRGLMLLLKCIKFDDPDEIYTHIKSAPLPVASELNVLAQEFKLGMITDACTNAVLSAGASQAAAAVLSNTDSVMSISSVEYAGTQNASVDSDSSPEIDMDTSSDAGYDEAVSQPAPLRAEGPTQLKPLSAGRLPVTSSRDITPSPPPGFSRSRAPSPPSAHPRAARVTTLSSQVQLLSDEEEDGEAKDGQLEEMDSPELVGGTLTTSDQITRTNSPSLELPPVHTPVTKRKLFENTMCAHETDRMVVYVEESSGGSESESGFDSDIEDSSGSALGQQAAGKRARLAGRSQSSTSLASMATASAANAPALAAPQKSSQVLLKAKKDLQAHEAEIARLKLQIKQRQTKALLLKKLQDSKRQQSETLNNSVSAPSTPSTRVVQDNIGDVPAEPAVSDATLEALTKEETKPDVTLDKPCVASAPAAAVKPEVTSDKPYVASASTAAVAQGNSGAETVESAVDDKAPTTPAKAVTKPDIAHVPHSTSHTKAHVARQHNLPNVEYGKLKSELAHAPDDVCKQHLATTAARLDDAIELKRMALRLLARQSPPIGGEAAGAEKKPFAQALARLDARNQRLEAERNELQSHMRRLHATIMLASAEKRVLTYSSDAGSELQAIISSGGSERSPQDLEREIQAIVRLRDNVSKLKEGYEARSDRDSNTNTGPQKAAVATEPPEEASEKPAEKPAVPSVATPAPKPAVVALRAKLASMQVEQSTMSQRLATLAEKRKQGEAATSTFAQPQSKKAKADAGAGTMPLRKDYSASKWTSLRLVLATISQSLGYYSNTHDSWCAMMIESLDSSILQPLTVIDRIGVPGVICPALSFGAELGANKQPTNAVQAAVAHATPNPESTVKGAESRKEYAPYDSVLGGIGAADETTAAGTLDEKPKATEAGSVNLDKLTSRHLLAAIREAPQEFHMGRRYYEDMRRALSIYATDDGDDRISIRNGDLARTLLPVWDKYKHQFPLKHIMAKNLLYKELDLGSITRNSGLGDYASEGKLRPHVFWLVNGYRTSLPVLNRDIALCGKLGKRVKNKKGAKSGKDAKRYFNAANSPDGDTSLDAAGPDTSASNASYRRALSIFGRWRKKLNYRPMAADLNTCLLDVANTDTGQAVLVLGKALEWHPESEKLWDLYLELYTRQKPSEEDVVSAFSDATRFHPHSACIWKRYVVWCGWNATYHAKDAPAGAWLKRLLMVAPMAVKCLASTQTKPRSEGLSAAIAELIIYFWECLWSVHGSAAHMANTDQFSPALLASMRASLLAGSMQALIDEMAGADSNAGTDTQSETPGGALHLDT
ncbi:hypothetical protein IWW50_001564 [Coemansia erecta]|nr:hypothetical protein IWW50_001564 [Coemansia erecta]